MRVHQQSEELLRAIDADEAEQMAQLLEDLRWDGVREVARQEGVTEADALMQQLGDLQDQYGSLQNQLEEARLAAESATGRSRAVARQLAELQSQYAAVSGLRDDYLALQRQLEAAGTRQEGDAPGAAELRHQLASAEMALVGLQRESLLLRQQLSETRTSLAKADPLETEAGRRWVWLVASLVVTLGILVVIAAYLPR
jgi:chromosome segregation ATPase